MRRSDREIRTARALERAITRAANRPSRAARRRSRGQTLVIFALAFTALVGFMGLAIDSVRVYDLYARMQRAAEAGALAGVIYMPSYYSSNIVQSPYDNAVCRALQETSKNGFGTYCNPSSQPASIASMCPASQSSIEIAVCQVTGLPHDLKVYITENINLVFLSALGVGQLTLTASAQAEYIPPVDVAVDPSNPGGTGTWGTFGSCGFAASSACSTGVRNWAGNINGPGELKEQGDPMVTCEEGPSGLNPSLPYGSTDTVSNVTFTGLPTNHPQYYNNYNATQPGSVPPCSNPDTSNAFTGPAYYGGPQHAGYAFYVNIPSGDPGESLWVWNAPFSPNSKNSCNGRTGGQSQTSYDTFYFYNCSGSSSNAYPYYPGTTCYLLGTPINPYTCTDPNLYFSVTYTIYSITSTTNPAPIGAPVATFTAWPYEVGDVLGCSGDYKPLSTAPLYATTGSGCMTSNCIIQWCPIADRVGDTGPLWTGPKLTGGTYRVMVTVSDYGQPSNFNTGYGGHAYSLKLCPYGTTQANVPSCTPNSTGGQGPVIAGWTASDALFAFPGGGGGSGASQTTEYPLGYVGPEFAGRTLDIQLYDEGDLQGTNSSNKGSTIYAVSPYVSGYTGDPCLVSKTNLTGAGYASSNFIFPYNERTAQFTKQSPLIGIEGSLNGDIIYNGLWADEQVVVPSNYTGGNWTICAIAPQTNDSDVVGIRVEALGESPVHLVGA